MPLVWIGQIVTDRDGRGRRVEVLFDVVEPQELARGRHVERAVPHRDAIGLIEAGGDGHDTIGLVIAVTVDNGIDLAGKLRPDEYRAVRAERHHPCVPDVLGEHVSMKSGREHQRAKRRRSLTSGGRQARRKNTDTHRNTKPTHRHDHGWPSIFRVDGYFPGARLRR